MVADISCAIRKSIIAGHRDIAVTFIKKYYYMG